jgi:molybdopterin-guanine dinucleotide biosynthesis protein A
LTGGTGKWNGGATETRRAAVPSASGQPIVDRHTGDALVSREQTLLIDAIVLAGGRSSRLGGVPKSGLLYRNRALLEHAVASVRTSRRTVVVGDVVVGDADAGRQSRQVLITREDPPFGGPAAGIAAGIALLARTDPTPSDYLIVIACDMPRIAAATAMLLEPLPCPPHIDGIIARDAEGRLQPLAAVYRTTALSDAVERRQRSGDVHGLSVFELIAGLNLAPVTVPRGSTDDIDTWPDAARFGMRIPDSLPTAKE